VAESTDPHHQLGRSRKSSVTTWQTVFNELKWRGMLLCAELHDNAAGAVWSGRRIA